ncbi:Uncharacterized protein VirK/YbjX [Massilia sp. PDC64]|nr:DUF535 family protein [Massilia sp. PDC64]SDD97461.1 Uncharacterized protein VirK/YbjX [Massilia sp. PDC64]
MVFALLTRHWKARRHYPFASWAACIARSLRVLLFHRAHAELLAMDVYRNYVTQVHDDVFHHLSHRNYLAQGLSLRQRVRCVLTHYRFEDATFDTAYKQAVYRDGGLVLWQHEADGSKVEVRLGMAQRLNAEGDLTLTLLANGRRVHRLSFSWVDEHFAGLAGLGMAGILPFIARNQGHRADEVDAVNAFRRAFPANSPLVTTPGFFCCAALQGIAQALGMDHVVAVKSARHCAWAPSHARHFATAYDDTWRSLGGTEMPGRAWYIALPFHARPLAKIPSKHRKRAALRRAYWQGIAESARQVMLRHLAPQQVHKQNGRRPQERRPLQPS